MRTGTRVFVHEALEAATAADEAVAVCPDTVTVQEALFPSLDAVIVAWPGATAATTPDASTVATAVLLLLYVNVAFAVDGSATG
ncbi:MAG: hypothetical protein ABF449_09030 [Ethanoligenens sp.]